MSKNPFWNDIRNAEELWRQNNHEAALHLLTHSIGVCPDEAALLQKRAELLMEMSRYNEAIEDYTLALELLPGDILLYQSRAVAFAAVNNYEAAIEDANSIVKNNPKNPKFYS